MTGLPEYHLAPVFTNPFSMSNDSINVFKANDPTISWDGTVMNKGKKCPPGTYFYVINYKLKNRVENDGQGPISGTVTLIRD